MGSEVRNRVEGIKITTIGHSHWQATLANRKEVILNETSSVVLIPTTVTAPHASSFIRREMAVWGKESP